eukprot:4967971-Amphidinium_carterae.1
MQNVGMNRSKCRHETGVQPDYWKKMCYGWLFWPVPSRRGTVLAPRSFQAMLSCCALLEHWRLLYVLLVNYSPNRNDYIT